MIRINDIIDKVSEANPDSDLDIIDRAYILHDGSVLMSGSPDEVVADANVRRVYLGEGFRF